MHRASARIALTALALIAPLAVARGAAPVVEAGTPAPNASDASERQAEEAGRTPEGRTPEGRTPLMTPPGGEGRARQRARGGAAPSGEDAAARLFVQLQQLQQEVMELRGLVEEQRHALDRLRREQRERYLDLDRRVSELSGGGSGRGGGSANLPGAAGAAAVAEAENEQAAYEAAFALMREKRYEEAIDAFNRLLTEYPDGQYVPNAYYWLGELHLAKPDSDLEKSRQSFVQVLELFPEHRKVPDALYKLGVVYHQLGERDEARERLKRVRDEFPGTPAAKLAANYLDKLEES